MDTLGSVYAYMCAPILGYLQFKHRDIGILFNLMSVTSVSAFLPNKSLGELLLGDVINRSLL